MHRRRLGRLLVAASLVGPLVLSLTPTASAEEVVGGPQLGLSGRQVNLLDGADPLPQVSAETWVLVDLDTGEVLAAKNAHERRPPASTLKMLTALTVMPRTSLTDVYVATGRAAGNYGERVGLRPGKRYTMDDLWNAVLLPSANDAALAVAQANGSVAKTVRQMNEVAAGLQAFDTVAKNTSGLDAPGQLSSAYDLALIARAALAMPDFASYVGKAKAQFPNLRGKRTHTIYTTNRLVLHGYPGVIGVKTGYTTKAGRTFVAAATRKGRTLLVALMGITESSETAAAKLLDWGFRNGGKVAPVGQLVGPQGDGAAETPVLTSSDAAPLPSPTSESAPQTAATPAVSMAIDRGWLAGGLGVAALIVAVLIGTLAIVTRGREEPEEAG